MSDESGSQAIRWCVVHRFIAWRDADGVERSCLAAGYRGDARDCQIVGATVTWGTPADEWLVKVQQPPPHTRWRRILNAVWPFNPWQRHRCLAEGCGVVVDYRLEFCDWHAWEAVAP